MYYYKVSVVIPVYNAEKHIARCVRSLLSQTLDNVEFIFIDDASLDNSVEIIKTILQKYPNRNNDVRIIRNPKNQGVARSRQTGIENVTGTYTIHCDSDDWMDSDYLERMYDLAKTTNADFVYSDYTAEYENHSVYMPQTLDNVSVNELKKGLTKQIWGGLWNKLIKTSIFFNRISFQENINYQEDLLFCYKCLCNCQTCSYLSRGGVSLHQNQYKFNILSA